MINEERRKIQHEALQALEDSDYNGIFLLPTGLGKSWVMIEALKRLVSLHNYKKIWYLCNSTALRDVDFVNELKQWDAEYLIPLINRMCYQKAHKIEGEDVDVVLADEFDYSLTDVYSQVYTKNNFKHKVLTTAFIAEDKLPLIKNIAKVVYSSSLLEIENKNVLNKSSYNFVNFLMTQDETATYKRYGQTLKELINRKQELSFKIINQIDESKQSSYHRDLNYIKYKIESTTLARKRFLNALTSSADICRKLMKEIYLSDKDCKILTFCELTMQADRVSKYSYHGNDNKENLQKFRDGVIQSLSVCGKVNRGVNISNIRYIIFESSNGSKTQMTQRLGRGKRLKQDEMLNVYFLIPCYYEGGKIKYTKVKDWIEKAGKDYLSEARNYRFKS